MTSQPSWPPPEDAFKDSSANLMILQRPWAAICRSARASLDMGLKPISLCRRRPFGPEGTAPEEAKRPSASSLFSPIYLLARTFSLSAIKRTACIVLPSCA